MNNYFVNVIPNKWVIIPFSAAPYSSPIRFRKEWWMRESYHFATKIDPAIVKAYKIKYVIPPNSLVLAEKTRVETDMLQHILEEKLDAKN